MPYRAEIVTEPPNAIPTVEFLPSGGLGSVAMQVLVHVVGSDPWVGIFRGASDSHVTILESWSQGPMLLVVAEGFPHFVDTRQPGHSMDLPVFPVRHAIRHRSGVLVLADFTRICGVDGDGIRWVAPEVAQDWIEDLRLDGQMVRGSGSVVGTDDYAPFAIDIKDGRFRPEATDAQKPELPT